MGLITRSLPGELTADGRVYPIATDYRRWLLILGLMEECLPAERKLALAAKIAGVSEEAALTEDLARALLTFLSGGVPVTEEAAGGERGEPVFDFEADGDAVFAGFWQTYGIDLTEKSLHWWVFLALLKHLPPDSAVMERVRPRSLDLRGIGDDDLRKQLRRAKARVRLPRRSMGKKEV